MKMVEERCLLNLQPEHNKDIKKYGILVYGPVNSSYKILKVKLWLYWEATLELVEGYIFNL